MSREGSALLAPAGKAYEAAKLRWASLGDRARLEHLFSAARPDGTEDPEPMATWLEHGGAVMLENAEGTLLCAVRWREAGEGWELDRVCTLPEARGMGFGRWLMTKVEALAIRYNVPSLAVALPDGEMEDYYRRLGYTVTDAGGGSKRASKRVGGLWQMQERPST